MRTNHYILLFLLFLSFNINAQSWVNQVSGTTNALRQVSFINTNEGWAVGSSGTLLKTTNGGSTWTAKTFVNSSLLIGCYFFDSSTGWVVGDDGAYKTTDGGNTWTHVTGSTLLTRIFFANSLLGFGVGGSTAGQYGAIHKTTDGGATWTSTINSTTWHRMYGLQFVSLVTGFVFDENGLMLKTTDAGVSWNPVSYGTQMTITAMKFRDPNNGWLSGYNGSTAYLLKTTDGGGTWNSAVNNFQYALNDFCFIFSNIIWAPGANQTESFIFNSTDGGSTWTNFSTGTKAWNSMYFNDYKNGWVVGNNGEIMKYNGVSGVKDGASNTPKSFALLQNFPNPFNPNTTIKFVIPEKSLVNLSVYNLLGVKVAELANGNKNAGEYHVDFNASGLASGVYLYKLNAGSFSSSNKMIILK
jgi:photosystem II stability/assembly factor-like uncharacterized protein